jgi:hypothetical protein
MNHDTAPAALRAALLACILIAVAVHLHGKASLQKKELVQKSMVVSQALVERQLEARINWDVAERIEAGEFKTEDQIVHSIKSRWPYAEGESRLALDEELQAVVGWIAIEKDLTVNDKKPSPEEIQAEQLKRWVKVLRFRALEGDPTIKEQHGERDH